MKIEGNILLIGINDNKLIAKLSKDINVKNIDLLECNTSDGDKALRKQKKVYPKDLYKKFKNKDISYIYIDLNNIKQNQALIIKNTLKIAKEQIIITNNVNETIKRYKKYGVKNNKEKILIKDYKKNFLKEQTIYIFDYISEMYNKLIELLDM